MTIENLPAMPVTIERDVPATMRDGTVLRADVYRPTGPAAAGSGGGVPVLLARSPYDKRVNVSTFGNSHPAWYASHGYMVVIQDCRGRYTSGGDFYPFAHETDDGYDTVEWAAGPTTCAPPAGAAPSQAAVRAHAKPPRGTAHTGWETRPIRWPQGPAVSATRSRGAAERHSWAAAALLASATAVVRVGCGRLPSSCRWQRISAQFVGV